MDPAICAQKNIFSAPVVPVLRSGREAVATRITLQLLLTVFAVKIIFAGRAQVQEFTGRRPGWRVYRCGSGACFDPTENSLPAMSAVGTGAGCLGSFLPVVIKGDKFSRLLVGKQFFSNPEEILAILS